MFRLLFLKHLLITRIVVDFIFEEFDITLLCIADSSLGFWYRESWLILVTVQVLFSACVLREEHYSEEETLKRFSPQELYRELDLGR